MTGPSVWIVNASPFIGLAKAGHLDLLTAPGRTVFLPETVAREIGAGPPEDPAVPAVNAVARGALGISVLPSGVAAPRVAALRLDAGEAAVLTEALARPGSVAVIDDGQGRAAANRLGVPVTGSLGVLILAKREGRLSAVAPAVRAMKAAGIFLPGDKSLQMLLAALGETWL